MPSGGQTRAAFPNAVDEQGQFLAVLASGLTAADKGVTVPYHRYARVNGSWYEAQNTESFMAEVKADENETSVVFIPSTISFYEDMNDMESTGSTKNDATCSNGNALCFGGWSSNIVKGKVLIPAGWYEFNIKGPE